MQTEMPSICSFISNLKMVLRVDSINIAIQFQELNFLNHVVSLYNIRQFLDCFHDMQEGELYPYEWLAIMWSSNDHEINFYTIYF